MSQPGFVIPSLDGVRAAAVLIVFIGHSHVAPGRWPGHVGVTIFFFLSGYLITTLLRREREKTGRISLPKFYLRRLLRIQPPALIAIGLAALVGAAGLLQSTQNEWGILAEIANYTNYYMVYEFSETGDAHHGLPPESSMLWSLGVEEHFYLLFPALMIALAAAKLTRRQMGGLLVALAAIAPLWRLWLYDGGASFYRLYVSTDTRYDGLLLGAALALLWNPALDEARPLGLSSRLIDRWLTPLALVCVAAAALAPAALRLTVADTLIYVALTFVFCTIISSPAGHLGRLLNLPWMVHLGRLSFSVYLLHRLALGLAGEYLPGPALLADICALAVSIALAQLMFVWVEHPLARLRRRLEASSMSRRNQHAPA